MIEIATPYEDRMSSSEAMTYKTKTAFDSLKDRVIAIFRNRAIDARIKKLSASIADNKAWAALSDEEKEREVRRIASVRHAIERMKRMKK